MKIVLITIAPFFILGLLALAIPICFVLLPYLIYERRCKMIEKIKAMEFDYEEPKSETNFLKSGFSLVNQWANQKTDKK